MGASRRACYLFPFLVLLSTCFLFSSASRLLKEEIGCVESIDDQCPVSGAGSSPIGAVPGGTNNAPGSVCFACANNNLGGLVIALPGISMPGLAIGLPTISIGGAGIQIGGYGYGGMVGYIPGYGYGYSLCCVPVGYGYGPQTLIPVPQQDSTQTGSKPSVHMDSHQIQESVSGNEMQRRESKAHTLNKEMGKQGMMGVNHEKQDMIGVNHEKQDMVGVNHEKQDRMGVNHEKQDRMGANYNKNIVKPKTETIETRMHGSKDIHEGVVKTDIGKQSGGNNHKSMHTMPPMSH